MILEVRIRPNSKIAQDGDDRQRKIQKISNQQTFNSARISGMPFPDAHMRKINPNFSLYRAFHSTSSYRIRGMTISKTRPGQVM